jgi:hypothetical protein
MFVLSHLLRPLFKDELELLDAGNSLFSGFSGRRLGFKKLKIEMCIWAGIQTTVVTMDIVSYNKKQGVPICFKHSQMLLFHLNISYIYIYI